MATKKTIWVAEDGTNHNSRDAAEIYEGLLDLYKYIDDNPIYCGTETPVRGQEFGLWLREHTRIFIKLLPAEHGSPTNLADARREAQRTVPETEGEADRNGDEGYFPDGG